MIQLVITQISYWTSKDIILLMYETHKTCMYCDILIFCIFIFTHLAANVFEKKYFGKSVLENRLMLFKYVCGHLV